MEKSLSYKDVISAQAKNTEEHEEAFLTECAAEGTGNFMTENQFKETSDLVTSGIPMIEVQLKTECSTFHDCLEQVLSSEHYSENGSVNDNEQVSY